MATADVILPTEPSTLFYYLELKDGGIVQTYPGTAFEKRRRHVPHDVNIQDLRSIKDQFTIERNGFQLVNHVTEEKDFLDEEQVRKIYYPSCQALVKKL